MALGFSLSYRQFVCVFLISLVLNAEVIAKVNILWNNGELWNCTYIRFYGIDHIDINYIIYVFPQDPITYNLRYTKHCRICSSWSWPERFSDYSKSYPVVPDFTKYASTIDEFILEYPLVTIETSGEAVSGSTFGRICTASFGTVTFETIDFNNRNYYNENMCANHDYNGNYDVGVEIGIGFKIDGNKLYIRPFMNGWMVSVGWYERCLDFGLDVTSITFHPKSEKEYFVNLIQ